MILSALSRLSLLSLLALLPVRCPGPQIVPPFIINVHEHLESRDDLPALLEAMDRLQIEKTVLLGTPSATFNPLVREFREYESNNELILEIAKNNPNRFIAFVTVDPQDPRKLERLKDYLTRGARGVKLYSGHRMFHDLPLDSPEMEPVYEFCQRNKLPVVFHVNAGYFEEELSAVLDRHPGLKVICPHYCLSSIATERFVRLMEAHPNLYTDTSFGAGNLLVTGLIRFSDDKETYRKLILRFQDRILFGTDTVVSKGEGSSEFFPVAEAYRSLLEERSYRTKMGSGGKLSGLSLPRKVLRRIYRDNFINL